MITNKNSFRKLYDGSWAIVVCDGTGHPGATVTVSMRDGSTKQVELGEQLPGVDTMMQAPLFKVAPKATNKAAPVKSNVGDLSRLLEMFDKASTHKNSPAIVLSVPAIGETIKINMAKASHRVPGSLNVISQTRTDDRGQNVWYGRVLRDGSFEQRGVAPQAIVDRLIALAKDPVRVAFEHGKLTSNCCFCNTTLDHPNSVKLGYGPICADHFGLPHSYAHGDHEDDDERIMQEIEAKGDREQTIRDEFNKMTRRRRMEKRASA